MKKSKVIRKIVILAIFLLVLLGNMCFATSTGIGTAEVQTATENIKRVITSIAMPLGGVLIFASIVIAAIKMIVNANNPQKELNLLAHLLGFVVEVLF